MTKEQSDRVPFDMGLDPAMDSPELFSKRAPEAVFIPAGSASRDTYGHRHFGHYHDTIDIGKHTILYESIDRII